MDEYLKELIENFLRICIHKDQDCLKAILH